MDYKKMYFKSQAIIADVIEMLAEHQRQCEEEFCSFDDESSRANEGEICSM